MGALPLLNLQRINNIISNSMKNNKKRYIKKPLSADKLGNLPWKSKLSVTLSDTREHNTTVPIRECKSTPKRLARRAQLSLTRGGNLFMEALVLFCNCSYRSFAVTVFHQAAQLHQHPNLQRQQFAMSRGGNTERG